MVVKKFKGKVIGAELTADERKAIDIEIRKQLAEMDRKNSCEFDAMVLYILHKEFGFGPKRLKQFYDNFTEGLKNMLERYEMDESDQVWLCTYKLKQIGVDVEKWHNEK
jgi:hypothetical protein